jgi:Zn-dependent M16 (insulinase) family peptidase
MLERRQHEPQDAAVLPTLSLSDLVAPARREAVLVAAESRLDRQYKQYHLSIEPNLNFYRLVFTFETVSQELEEAVMLWSYTINSTISTKSRSYKSLTLQLGTLTSGFHLFSSAGPSDSLNLVFEFSCLPANATAALGLLEEIIFEPVF